jgi:hypothetical protein
MMVKNKNKNKKMERRLEYLLQRLWAEKEIFFFFFLLHENCTSVTQTTFFIYFHFAIYVFQ